MLSSFNIKEMFHSFCSNNHFIRRFFCPSKSLVYFDALENTAISDDAVLVLSPRDYWVLRVSLNVKTEKEAAMFGASLFDLSEEHHYIAQRLEKNDYILIAYNPNEISQRLNSIPSLSSIKKITFAQCVFADEEYPILLPNGKYLIILDKIVIEADATYLSTHTSIELSSALSHQRVNLKTVNIERFIPSELTSKTLRNTLIILLILLANLAATFVTKYQESLYFNEKIANTLSSSKLPETSLEREAILDSLTKKEKKQLRMRELCKKVNELPIERKNTAAPILPSLPPVNAPSTDGIVLIPGSQPGEPNRLLVDNTSSAPTISLNSEGIRELEFDGNSMNLIISTSDTNERNSLKNKIISHFKHAQIDEHETLIEVRIK